MRDIDRSRRGFLKASVIAGLTVMVAPLGSRAFAALFEEKILRPLQWDAASGGAKLRIDGIAKVTGAKVFARDVRAPDMPHWPKQQSHAFILRTTQADRVYARFRPDIAWRRTTARQNRHGRGSVGPPDITPAGLAARGWNGADLRTFFATGISRQGSAFGEMHPVVVLSSQYLTQSDLRAMSTYLIGRAFAAHARATRFRRCRATGCRQDKLCRCVRGLSWARGGRQAARRGIDARKLDAAPGRSAQPDRRDARWCRRRGVRGNEEHAGDAGIRRHAQRRRTRAPRQLPALGLRRPGG